jgi:sulfoxide reductase heme-binding subunit YedZ
MNWLSHFRRMLGLFAFFYGCVHLLIYFTFDRGLSLSSLVSETAERPFILFGMTALLLMLPLAITSTNSMVRRLGAAKWKRLHQLAYVSAIAGVVHYYYSSKVTSRLQIAFIVALALLLGYRVAVRWLPFLKYRKSTPARAAVESK